MDVDERRSVWRRNLGCVVRWGHMLSLLRAGVLLLRTCSATSATSLNVTDPELSLLIGLVLALLSAASINVGFLLQHRGLRERLPEQAAPWGLIRAGFGSRTWLSGQALGSVGYAVQIAAVAIAPLSLVQAFAAGGLAVSVPLGARLFGHRIATDQALAIVLVAAALASLPVALSGSGDRLHATTLIGAVVVATALATALALRPSAAMRAIAAGLFYGVTDAAIKAISVRWSRHGAEALMSGWTALALAATLAGFLSFQAALRSGSAVPAISLMTAFAALVALACGVFGFGESLGTSPAAVMVHLLAVGVVLGCVPVLARAQAEIADLPGGQDEVRAALGDHQRRGVGVP